eukprot:1186866-Prorocentrum_minimum.AAC.2
MAAAGPEARAATTGWDTTPHNPPAPEGYFWYVSSVHRVIPVPTTAKEHTHTHTHTGNPLPFLSTSVQIAPQGFRSLCP